jgi:hypothetical protein
MRRREFLPAELPSAWLLAARAARRNAGDWFSQCRFCPGLRAALGGFFSKGSVKPVTSMAAT